MVCPPAALDLARGNLVEPERWTSSNDMERGTSLARMHTRKGIMNTGEGEGPDRIHAGPALWGGSAKAAMLPR